ncbi:hypothetical protein J3F83DRAFT_747819 [Trichoderma novae-zelandiae]
MHDTTDEINNSSNSINSCRRQHRRRELPELSESPVDQRRHDPGTETPRPGIFSQLRRLSPARALSSLAVSWLTRPQVSSAPPLRCSALLPMKPSSSAAHSQRQKEEEEEEEEEERARYWYCPDVILHPPPVGAVSTRHPKKPYYSRGSSAFCDSSASYSSFCPSHTRFAALRFTPPCLCFFSLSRIIPILYLLCPVWLPGLAAFQSPRLIASVHIHLYSSRGSSGSSGRNK